MGLRSELIVLEEGNFGKGSNGGKAKEDKGRKWGYLKVERRRIGCFTEKVVVELRGQKEERAENVDLEDIDVKEDPWIVSTETSHLNPEPKEDLARLLKPTKGEDQGKILLLKETAQDFTKMHITQSHRKGIQAKHLNECQDDAHGLIRRGWRDWYEEKIHQD